MINVKKRDGKIVEFDIQKIKDAIEKAFLALDKKYTPDIIELISLRAAALIENELVTVEEIQDNVEAALIQAGYIDVAKAYILYRKQHEKMRNIKSTFLA